MTFRAAKTMFKSIARTHEAPLFIVTAAFRKPRPFISYFRSHPLFERTPREPEPASRRGHCHRSRGDPPDRRALRPHGGTHLFLGFYFLFRRLRGFTGTFSRVRRLFAPRGEHLRIIARLRMNGVALGLTRLHTGCSSEVEDRCRDKEICRCSGGDLEGARYRRIFSGPRMHAKNNSDSD